MTAWRSIDQHYEVSDDGQVRRSSDGRIMGQWLNGGYCLVRLNHPRRTCRVHRLVAEAFIPNPTARPFVNHINCTPSDNHVTNLEWCTQKENLAHSARLGRMQRDYWRGKRSVNAGISDEKAAEVRRRYAAGGISWKRLGLELGISKRTIGRIVKGETYV